MSHRSDYIRSLMHFRRLIPWQRHHSSTSVSADVAKLRQFYGVSIGKSLNLAPLGLIRTASELWDDRLYILRYALERGS